MDRKSLFYDAVKFLGEAAAALDQAHACLKDLEIAKISTEEGRTVLQVNNDALELLVAVVKEQQEGN
jgi:hypothetical protein